MPATAETAPNVGEDCPTADGASVDVDRGLIAVAFHLGSCLEGCARASGGG